MPPRSLPEMNNETASTPLCKVPLGAGLHLRLANLEAIHDKIEESQRRFRQSACAQARCITCADGCGRCCEGFMPDLLQIEADAIAVHLLTHRTDLIARLESPGTACPFIEEDKPGMNCGIYPARPLVCRLFGFSATMGKRDEPEFTLCRHMAPLNGVSERTFAGRNTLDELFGLQPPIMGHFSMEAASIDPESSGARTSLAIAVPRSLAKIGLCTTLMNAGSL